MDSRLMKALSSEINLRLLSLLSSGSFNPRELAKILKRDESDVSRRLRLLESLGLVEGRWERINNRNVRVYTLKVEEIRIAFESGEVVINSSGIQTRLAFPNREETPRVERVFGREKERTLISESPERVVIVHGIAGIGKSTLVAWIFQDAFWYTLSEVDSLESLAWRIGRFFSSLGYPDLTEYLRSGGREERTVFELINEGLDRTDSVVVIDDLHRCTDDRITSLLGFVARKKGRGRMVVTSRERPNLGTEGILYLNLKGLGPKEAYRLFLDKGGTASVREFATIYQITRGHPLAIILSAQGQGAVDSRENLFEFLFGEVYSSLTPDERRMVNILGLFDEPIEYAAIKQLYERRNSFPVLYSLMKKGIVERLGNGYHLHELLRELVKKLSPPNGEEYYSAYIDYLMEKGDAESFLRALKYSLRLKTSDRFHELLDLRVRRFKRIVQDYPLTYQRILRLSGKDPLVKKELGHVYFQKGFFEKAVKLWLEVKDLMRGIHRADVLSSLVDVYCELEETTEAEFYLRELENLLKSLNDPLAEFWYYVEKTKLLWLKGELKGALKSAFMELKTLKKIGEIPEAEASAYLHIGDIYTALGKFERGIEYYKTALELARLHALPFLENLSNMELGKGYYEIGEYKKAVEHLKKAAEYFLEVRNYRRAVDSLAYLCVSLIGLGKTSEAIDKAIEMVRIAHSTGYPLGWAGYIFHGAALEMEGKSGKSFFIAGVRKLREYPHLYGAVLEELGKVFNVSRIREL